MNTAIAAALGLFLSSFGHSYAQGYYPGPQSGHYVYGADHEYHLLSRNQPFMVLRPYCNPQWNPDCNVLPPPGYPLQPLIPIAPPPPVTQLPPPAHSASPTMEQSREAVIRAGEAHCKRFNDPEVCHEKK
jgi:hypothetical protein